MKTRILSALAMTTLTLLLAFLSPFFYKWYYGIVEWEYSFIPLMASICLWIAIAFLNFAAWAYALTTITENK